MQIFQGVNDLNFEGQLGKLIKHPLKICVLLPVELLTKGHLIQASVFKRGASVSSVARKDVDLEVSFCGVLSKDRAASFPG